MNGMKASTVLLELALLCLHGLEWPRMETSTVLPEFALLCSGGKHNLHNLHNLKDQSKGLVTFGTLNTDN